MWGFLYGLDILCVHLCLARLYQALWGTWQVWCVARRAFDKVLTVCNFKQLFPCPLLLSCLLTNSQVLFVQDSWRPHQILCCIRTVFSVVPQCYRTPLLRIGARGCPHTVIFLCGLKNIHIASRNEVSCILHTHTHVRPPLENKHRSKVAFIGWVLVPRYFRPKRHAHDPYIPQY